jgi:flagellar basal-body rod protein FlgG
MDRMIYLAMSGAKALSQRQEALTNNLANASTSGFRADMMTFRSVPVRAEGTATTRVFNLEATAGFSVQPGPVSTTGRSLDAAIRGQGWFVVQTPDGNEALTRNGNFHIGADGTLQTANGLPVVGDGGPITLPPNAEVLFGADGTITARQGNQPPLQVGKLKLANPEPNTLAKGADGMVRITGGDPPSRRPGGADCRWRSGRQQRQRRRVDGRNDRAGPPVRDADEAAVQRRAERTAGRAIAVAEGLSGARAPRRSHTMIRSLWIAKTGLDAQQTQLDTITHNLANVSTVGYKRSHAVFEDLLYQNMRQAGAQSTQQTQLPTGLQLGVGVRTVATARVFTQGVLQQTDNKLDIAINGNGFFPIQQPDGTVAYTRDGQFRVDAQGQLVTSNGMPIAPPITIPANALAVTVGADGVVSINTPGQTASTTVGQIQLASFVNPAGLDPHGQNLFVETTASGTATLGAAGTNGTGTLKQGFVETSNVNVVEELVAMIQTQRAYEINSKAIQTSDQMLARLGQL